LIFDIDNGLSWPVIIILYFFFKTEVLLQYKREREREREVEKKKSWWLDLRKFAKSASKKNH
jgi:hypothetical protein